MACPAVAGAAALLLQAHPGLPLEEVQRALAVTSRDMGPAGADNDFGAGIVDVAAALAWLEQDALDVRVVDEAGEPVSATVRLGEEAHETDAAGSLYLRPGAGEHPVLVRSFGYLPWSGVATITPGSAAELVVVLQRRPWGVVHGKVRTPEGEGVPALMRSPGSGWAGTRSLPGGEFQFELPRGSYPLRLFAPGRRPSSVEVQVGEDPVELELVMEAAPEALLVDDDGGADREATYRAILEARPGGADVAAVSADSIRSWEELIGYRVVVWITGEGTGSLDAERREALRRFLRQGGRVLISGGQVARSLEGTAFLANLVGARIRQGEEITSDGAYPTGHSDLAATLERSDFSGDLGPMVSLDAVRPIGNVFLNFAMGLPWKHRGAAVARRSRGSATALVAFPMEEIAEEQDRAAMLNAIVDWLASEDGAEAARRRVFRAR
jgi:hypothetical protein